jgi:hypothetical protein
MSEPDHTDDRYGGLLRNLIWWRVRRQVMASIGGVGAIGIYLAAIWTVSYPFDWFFPVVIGLVLFVGWFSICRTKYRIDHNLYGDNSKEVMEIVTYLIDQYAIK